MTSRVLQQQGSSLDYFCSVGSGFRVYLCVLGFRVYCFLKLVMCFGVLGGLRSEVSISVLKAASHGLNLF